jgi:hydroxymethylpyrimidine pyrophosphatase-like HAD family hydrolase
MPAVDLVVTDLDGTLWHTDDHLPGAVIEAVAELDRRGIPLLVATGRRLASTRAPLARYGLRPPAVILNGALGVHLANGARFHRAPFASQEGLAVLAAFQTVGLDPVVYVDHPEVDVFLGPVPATNPGHVAALGATARTVELTTVVGTEAVLGFSMIGVPPADGERAFAAIEPLAEVHLDRSIDYPGMVSFTVAPRGQSKWDGVEAYCAESGLATPRVLAVADGPNDLELLDRATVRAVPRVAHPAALERADHVLPPAAEGGWAEILSLVS